MRFANYVLGVVDVTTTEDQSEKYFISGGFCFVHEDSSCDITTFEAFPVSELDPERIKSEFDQWNQVPINY